MYCHSQGQLIKSDEEVLQTNVSNAFSEKLTLGYAVCTCSDQLTQMYIQNLQGLVSCGQGKHNYVKPVLSMHSFHNHIDFMWRILTIIDLANAISRTSKSVEPVILIWATNKCFMTGLVSSSTHFYARKWISRKKKRRERVPQTSQNFWGKDFCLISSQSPVVLGISWLLH